VGKDKREHCHERGIQCNMHEIDDAKGNENIYSLNEIGNE